MQGENSAIILRACYALHGTDIGHATSCPVLTYSMALLGGGGVGVSEAGARLRVYRGTAYRPTRPLLGIR
eukprot:3467544-Rhodomonas_salina.1